MTSAVAEKVWAEWRSWGDDSSGHRLLLLLLVAAQSLQSADESTVGATANVLHQQLSLTHTQIGLLATVSAAVGVVATVPIGMLADRWNRVRLLRAAVLLWTVGMIWVGATSSFASMMVARAALGAVVAAAWPITVSLVGDTVPFHRRGRVFGRLVAAQLAGLALGTTVSGELAGLVGWRWAYWWLAGVGLALVLGLARTEEPARRFTGPGAGRRRVGLREAVRTVVHNRTFVVLVVASALGFYFLDGISTFGFTYLHDRFGISQTLAPLVLIGIGAAAGVGVVVGSHLGDRLARRHPAGRIVAMMLAYVAALVFLLPGLVLPWAVVALPLLVLGAGFLGAVNPPLDAARVDIVPAPLLGRAESVRSVLRDGADATAPAVVGLLAGALGLSVAFALMAIPLVLAALLGAAALRTYPADAAAVAAGDGGLDDGGVDGAG